MMESRLISLYDTVGSPFCVAPNDGQKIYDQIFPILKRNEEVNLSFRNVDDLTPAFLSAAIGQLFESFDEKEISSLLKIENINPEDQFLVDIVIDDSKIYFENPQAFDDVYQEVMGEEW